MNEDLISRSALSEKLQAHHDFFVNGWGGFSNLPIKDKVRVDEITNCIAEVMNAPVVDAVEVVRCRDCKHWGDEDGKLQRSDGVLFARCKVHNYLIDGRHTGWCPTENDFCSYGERKEDDENG